MLRWFMKKQIVSDTEKTINKVSQLSETTQRIVAAKVYEKILRSLREIESTPGPSSPERDMVMKRQMTDAYEARHRALAHGAQDWSNPDWAEAAIIESFLFANSGKMGRKASEKIVDLTTSWVRSVLSDSEMEAIDTELESEPWNRR